MVKISKETTKYNGNLFTTSATVIFAHLFLSKKKRKKTAKQRREVWVAKIRLKRKEKKRKADPDPDGERERDQKLMIVEERCRLVLSIYGEPKGKIDEDIERERLYIFPARRERETDKERKFFISIHALL